MKENLSFSGLCYPSVSHREKRDKYLALLERSERLAKRIGRVGNRRTNWDHLDYTMSKISWNIEKSPGDLRRFTVSQAPVKDHQRMPVFRTHVRHGNNNNDNNRHDWVVKVIHWEMCKKFKFDHANKWYMHNPAPVLENDTRKLLWDFNIQTDHLISARRPDLINKKKKKKRKSAKLSTLLSRLTTKSNWKNVKREISTLTLLENWKNSGTWRWQ